MWQIYRLVLILATPVLFPYLWWIDRQRRATVKPEGPKNRPEGPLLWVHAASVGEVTAALTLLGHLSRTGILLQGHVLLTTQTASSAQLARRQFHAHPFLRKKGFHRFVPFDHPICVWLFMWRWRPDLAVFLESELWPIMLFSLHRKRIPVLLVNARLSEKSFMCWKRVPEIARRRLWRCFARILTQSAPDTAFFQALGADNISSSGNLKYASAVLPCDEQTLQLFQEKTAGRPLWVVASFHPEEEEFIVAAHQLLKAAFPSLLTILVPRYPESAARLVQRLGKEGTAQRSTGALPESGREFYIVDTFGELGLFYRLADIVLVGGSFVPIGGHNLIEPAQLECAILHGPHMEKCREITALFHQHAAAIQLNDATEIASTVKDLLEQPARCAALKSAAKELITTQQQFLKVFDIVAAPYFYLFNRRVTKKSVNNKFIG